MSTTELLFEVQADSRPGGQATLEGACVAAVEQQHDPPRSTAVHPAVHELCRDGGRAEPTELRVGGGEVQFAGLIFHAVSGEVHEQQVVRAAVHEEVLDRLTQVVGRRIDQRPDIESADGRVSKDLREGFGVMKWSLQLPQPRILVFSIRNDQGASDAGG
jgi:hypothetical protein